MPRPNKEMPARNRRQQKATRRSKRLAGNSPAAGDGDETDAAMDLQEGGEEVVSQSRSCSTSQNGRLLGEFDSDWVDATTDGGDVEQVVAPNRPCSSSPIERLPPELVTLIGQQLPVESRITLALASRTMMFKSGGIGPGTNNIALDENPPSQAEDADMEDEEDEEDEGYPLPTPRMMLLELLERDLLLLTRCDYCKKLHSPLSGVANSALQVCCRAGCSFTSRVGAWGTFCLTLPLIRRAVMWDRQGLDADSLLSTVKCCTNDTLGHDAPFRSLSTSQARVCGGSVIVKTQIFIARTSGRRRNGPPTARDLAALQDLLSSTTQHWETAQTGHEYLQSKYKTPECLAHRDAAGLPSRDHYHNFKCYRDDTGPARRALNPKLRCMLTHEAPCCARGCHKKDGPPGRIDGSQTRFFDHSATAVPVADPRNLWDRVLVFTDWRDLGDGASQFDVKWQRRPEISTFGLGCDDRRKNGSRVGDAYEAFEGAAEGAPYLPRLPRDVAKTLFGPRPPGILF